MKQQSFFKHTLVLVVVVLNAAAISHAFRTPSLQRSIHTAKCCRSRSYLSPTSSKCLQKSSTTLPTNYAWNLSSLSRRKTDRRQRTITIGLNAKKENTDEEAIIDSSNNDFAWIGGLVLPLWAVYISNQWSRSSLYYIVDFSDSATAFNAMNVDVGFTQAQYGVLASLVFTSLFAVASLAAGAISDRYNRKTITIGAAIVWSIATLGTSFADTYTQVLAWRVLMGLACAFVTPPAYTLIAEKVQKERVSLASSLYGTGVALGGAFASLSILLDETVGWRQALLIIAIYGFSAAGLAALILPNDPKDTKIDNNDDDNGGGIGKQLLEGEKSDSSSILDDVQEAFSTSRVRWLYLGSFLRFSSGLCIGVWSAPYYRQIFPGQEENYAVAQALITAVGGSVR